MGMSSQNPSLAPCFESAANPGTPIDMVRWYYHRIKEPVKKFLGWEPLINMFEKTVNV
jgi:hypothetical protein